MNKAFASNWTSLEKIDKPLKLDGNGKAIKNIQNKALFSELSGLLVKENNVDVPNITIENIRLVNFIGDESVSGALVNIVKCAKINNVSAQGKTMKAGIIGKATGSTIKNLSNLLIINNTSTTNTSTTTEYIGGIVGEAISSSIQYCNNNATINAKIIPKSSTSASENFAAAGGIVGYAKNTTIDNCYNTAGIAGNYTITTAYEYYVGGIVGKTGIVENAETTIEVDIKQINKISNCYNTGVIRAGTKTSTGLTYVGGIVGATTSNVENCVNEASIEARSKSSWYFDDENIGELIDDDQHDYFTMKHSTRHLYVYGIGSISSFATINNCAIDENAQIVANGNGLESNTIMYVWDKLAEKDSVIEVTAGGDGVNSGKIFKAVGMGFYYKSDINLGES